MKTKVLLDAINTVLPGTSSKGLISGTEMIVIIDGELTAYNDRISVSTFVDDPGLMIECAIKADDFKNIIKSIKEPEVDLSMGDNILSIVSEKTEAEIPVTSKINTILDMIKSLNTDDLEFTDLPKDFNNGLALTRFNVSDDYSDQNNLFCLNLADTFIYSADNFRLSRYKVNNSIGLNCLIPKNNLNDLYSFGAIAIAKSAGWVHFLNEDDAIFSCRLVVGPYPVNDTMFNIGEDSVVVELPDTLQETLESITSLYDEVLNAHKAVKIQFKGNKLYCEIEKEKVWVKKTLDLPNKKAPNVSFILSSVFLSEILTYTKEVKVTTKHAVFETPVFKHIILLQLGN